MNNINIVYIEQVLWQILARISLSVDLVSLLAWMPPAGYLLIFLHGFF